jgi:hypothetical protein
MGVKDETALVGNGSAEPVDIWYWENDEGAPEDTGNENEEGKTFVKEQVFQRPEHRSMRPRLLIPMESFEASNRAYIDAAVMAEKALESAHESQELLSNLRKGFYKELEHLREILKRAREEILSMRGGAARTEQNAKLEEYILETEVYYFDIVDGLDPELKEIFKECFKRFQRDLLTENFNLKEQLSVFTDPNDPDGPRKLLWYLISNKRCTVHDIPKICWKHFAKDTPEQEEFEDTLFEILGADKEEFRAYLRAKRAKAGAEDEMKREMDRLRNEVASYKQLA